MDNYEFCARFVTMLCPSRGATILDYGCGSGLIVELLNKRGYRASGCDVFYAGGDLRHDVAPELFAQGRIKDMPDGDIPFPTSSFDLVLSNQVLEHVPDLDGVLTEILRVLKPGGAFLALFPDRGIWREGHCGIPFAHRFPKQSRTRFWYLATLRRLGFGFHKGDKSVLQWSRDFCTWLDTWTFYRPYDEIRAAFARHFVDFGHHEALWLMTRFGDRVPMLSLLPTIVQSLIVYKWAGMVVTCRKPE